MSEPPQPFDELPELMASMRNIGSRRGMPNEPAVLQEEQERYFAPFLEARRAAAKARTHAQVMSALDGRRLLAQIDATIRALAGERHAARASARRAFEVELFETIEPLRVALHGLRDIANDAAESSADQRATWTIWLMQLRTVFRLADSCWPALSAALVSSFPERAPSVWRRRFGEEGRR